MREEIDTLEDVRWLHVKVFKAEGLSFAEMVPRLQELGLLECRNCSAGKPITRRTRSNLEICTTCEDTISQQWRRNITRLAEDEVDLVEARWEWIEAKRFVLRQCRAKFEQTVTKVSKRTRAGKPVEAADGSAVATIETTTTRNTERKIYAELLRLYNDVADSLARMRGLTVDDPEALTPTPRSKVRVVRAPGATVRDAEVGEHGAN